MFCGWQLHRDKPRLASLGSGELSVDVLTKSCAFNSLPIDTLKIAPVLQDWLHADLSRHGIPLSAIHEARLFARLFLSQIAFSQRSTNETWFAKGTPLTPPTLFCCELAFTCLIRPDEVAYSASYTDREEWPPHWPAA